MEQNTFFHEILIMSDNYNGPMLNFVFDFPACKAHHPAVDNSIPLSPNEDFNHITNTEISMKCTDGQVAMMDIEHLTQRNIIGQN